MNNILRGSTDFNRVRDGRESPDAYFDIDLSAAGESTINIAGNSFYCDANPLDGNAVVYFQDTDKLRGPSPFYVSPGFIARIPFTQVRIEWSSQPGKKIRIIYGVDTEFQPGSVSQVSFAGEVTVNDVIANNVQTVAADVVSGIGTNTRTLLLPAANVNGFNLKSVHVSAAAGTTGTTLAALIISPVAPTTYAGAQQLTLGATRVNNNVSQTSFCLDLTRRIPAGWGVYGLDVTSTVAGAAFYTASLQLF